MVLLLDAMHLGALATAVAVTWLALLRLDLGSSQKPQPGRLKAAPS